MMYTQEIKEERKREPYITMLSNKHKVNRSYVSRIFNNKVIPTKGDGLRVLRDIQQTYGEPLSKSELEN